MSKLDPRLFLSWKGPPKLLILLDLDLRRRVEAQSSIPSKAHGSSIRGQVGHGRMFMEKTVHVCTSTRLYVVRHVSPSG